MNAIANVLPSTSLPAYEWPAPIINNPSIALEDAGCLIERLGALAAASRNELHDAVCHAEGLPSHLQARAYSVWMMLVTAGEKLAEIDRLVTAIIEAEPFKPTTSVGKHVEMRRSLDWAEVVAVYKDAEGPPYTDASIAVAGKAFDRLLNTRAPNLRCLHEKMSIIVEGSNWSATGLADSLLADVEALARKIEITDPSADQAEG